MLIWNHKKKKMAREAELLKVLRYKEIIIRRLDKLNKIEDML